MLLNPSLTNQTSFKVLKVKVAHKTVKLGEDYHLSQIKSSIQSRLRNYLVKFQASSSQ
jgi:hypothetical protein